MTEIYKSTLTPGLRLRITERGKKSISFEVDRKTTDKRTGEVKIDVRKRETTPALFDVLIKAYEKE